MNINVRLKALEFGKDIDFVSKETVKELQKAIQRASILIYNEAIRLASQKLYMTREDYINALKYEKLGDNMYVIYLQEKMNHAEDGYSAYNMLPKLAQGPASKTAADGHRYTNIPFQHKPHAKDTKPEVANLAAAVKQIEKEARTKDSYITKTIKKTEHGQITHFKGIEKAGFHSHLENLVKYTMRAPGQKKQRTSYFTFRTASEKQDPGSMWVHPGYGGAKIFPTLEQFAEREIENIIKRILG